MKILYVCTHNRCRSILSEAITNQIANGKIQAISAGSQPAGEVHPLTLKYLTEMGYSTDGLKSQSWDEFEADQPDVVFTVCDSAAGEPCPVWFGNTIQLHWGLPDPSKVEGSESQVRLAFIDVIQRIEHRVKSMAALDFNKLSREDLTARLQSLTETEE